MKSWSENRNSTTYPTRDEYIQASAESMKARNATTLQWVAWGDASCKLINRFWNLPCDTDTAVELVADLAVVNESLKATTYRPVVERLRGRFYLLAGQFCEVTGEKLDHFLYRGL